MARSEVPLTIIRFSYQYLIPCLSFDGFLFHSYLLLRQSLRIIFIY